MLIVCPSCTNRLQVDAVMATGKTFRVRCSRCQLKFEVDRLTGKPTGVVGDAAPTPTPSSAGATPPGVMRPERATTVTGVPQRTTEVGRMASAAGGPPAPTAHVEAFRRSLPDRYARMRSLDEFALLDVGANATDVDLLHAYLRVAEEWRPSRYEGQLNAAEMEMVRTVATRLDKAYNDLGDAARRKRILAEREAKGETPPPRTGALPPRTGTPSTNTLAPNPAANQRGKEFPKEETSASIFFGHGVDALKNGRLLEAKEHFQHCISLDPKRAEFHHRLAVTVQRLGGGNGHTDWATVERCLAQAIDIEPDNIEYLVGMAKHWQVRGQISTAMKYYKRVRDLEPENMDATREIRLYLMRKKKDQQPTPTTAKLLGFFKK